MNKWKLGSLAPMSSLIAFSVSYKEVVAHLSRVLITVKTTYFRCLITEQNTATNSLTISRSDFNSYFA